LRRACWSCDGWVAGRCDKGSCGNNRDHLLNSVQIQVMCESAYINLIDSTCCHRFFEASVAEDVFVLCINIWVKDWSHLDGGIWAYMIVNERKYFFFDKLVDQLLFLGSERERFYDTLVMHSKNTLYKRLEIELTLRYARQFSTKTCLSHRGRAFCFSSETLKHISTAGSSIASTIGLNPTVSASEDSFSSIDDS
jgi:hypothetical protein